MTLENRPEPGRAENAEAVRCARTGRGPRVLLTTVCRPLGAAHGDAPSVGYELLYCQVTRAQGIFSPRATHLTFSLEYIAANLDAPTVVLHYPSREELVKELRQGPEFVGISFNLATYQRMKEAAELVRRHAPQAKIVLGGYGTVASDAMLATHGDYICRGEGVAFLRDLLGEPPRPMPYDHPLVISTLRVLSVPVGRTGMIFAGLGCPHGCDFCCTSHFFRRRHVRLLPTGDDVFRVIQRYREIDPKMSFTILDEDFLVAGDRARRLRELVQARGEPLSIFAFATVKALSRLTPRELLETGIDGVWVGFEGKRSGFAKQQGRPISELIPDLRSHGITVLASMIVGFDYQTEEIIREELAELLALKPTLAQFLIYGPTPGTPFFERVVREGRLRRDLAADSERYFRACDGFTAMVDHPTLSAREIEAMQRECFETDFRLLGPSVLRTVEGWLAGYRRYRNSDSAYLRAKAARWAEEVRRAYPLVRLAKRESPNPQAAARLETEIEATLGKPSLGARVLARLAPLAAAWTRFTLTRDRFQHPKLNRREHRMSWWALHSGEFGALRVEMERALEHTRIRLAGALDGRSARRLAVAIQSQLESTDARLHVLVEEGTEVKARYVKVLGRALARHRERIVVRIPSFPGAWSALGEWLEISPASA